MFYAMHISNNNYYMHISYIIRGTERSFRSYMRTRDMKEAHGSYNHEEEVRGLHVNIGNVET